MTGNVFDRETIQAVDRCAVDEYGLPGIVLMENAARGLAENVAEMIGDELARVLIVCGAGNNGGDGYALARHLHNAGVDVALLPLNEPKARTDAGINAAICHKMKLRRFEPVQLNGMGDITLVVDAVFGTGLDREVTGKAREVIEWMNASGRPVLAVDVPSGMDCNTGETLGAAVQATRTVTFGGMKTGFLQPMGEALVGEVDVVDIGVPSEVLERFGRRLQQA